MPNESLCVVLLKFTVVFSVLKFCKFAVRTEDLLNSKFLLTGIIWKRYTELNSIHVKRSDWEY